MVIDPTNRRIRKTAWYYGVRISLSSQAIKRKDESSTKVLPCTLITKDKEFELGNDLLSSKKKVFLNHPFCSQFCVLGNSSCS